MFRAVGYLSIVEVKQRQMAHEISLRAANQEMIHLQAARRSLEDKMKERNAQEEEKGFVSKQLRHGADLNDLQQRLLDRIRHVRMQMIQNRLVEYQLKLAQKTYDRFHLWQKAADVLAMFQALQPSEIRDIMSIEEKNTIQQAYASFLGQCQEFDLGISDETYSQNGTMSPQNAVPSRRSSRSCDIGERLGPRRFSLA
jgi:hypothetical protein